MAEARGTWNPGEIMADIVHAESGLLDPVLVSAVITTYNRRSEAIRALESVLNQTYTPLEVLVIEDGSDSGVRRWIIDNGLMGRVQYHRLETNQGLAAARNAGWRLAKGCYVAYLDDDDLWKPQRIEQQMRLVRGLSEDARNRLGVVTCATEMHFPRTGRVSIRLPGNKGNLRDSIVRFGASTPSSSFLFLRSALVSTGGFDESLASSIDHDIWMTLAVAGYETDYVAEPLVIHFDRFGRSTSMGATKRRILGVTQYVEKWQPTFVRWFGAEEGARYTEKYFIDVIGLLAAYKLVAGEFRDAWISIQAMSGRVKDYSYITRALTRESGRLLVQQLAPRVLLDSVKRLRSRLGGQT